MIHVPAAATYKSSAGLRAVVLVVLLVSMTCASALAQQQRPGPPQRPGQGGPLEVDITQGSLKPIPIAVPEFLGEDVQFALEVSNVVALDLERSGLFQPLDRASFLERPRDLNAPPRLQDWRVLNAQALVVGRAEHASDGRVV